MAHIWDLTAYTHTYMYGTKAKNFVIKIFMTHNTYIHMCIHTYVCTLAVNGQWLITFYFALVHLGQL